MTKTCKKFEKYEDTQQPDFDCVAVVGYKYPDIKKELFDGVIACKEEDIEKERGVHDVLEIFRSNDRKELHEAFARFWKDYRDVNLPKRSLSELNKMGENFLKEINKLSYVSSSEIVGSVKKEDPSPYSDVDIKVLRASCPGKKKCEIIKTMNKDKFEMIDVYCYPEKKK